MKALFLLAAVASAIAARGAYDVRDFGARGDGVADDTAAIQRALDAAASQGGGEVRVPPGTYRIGSLSLGWNTRLALAGGAANALDGFSAEAARLDPAVSAIVRPSRNVYPPIFVYNLVPPAYITNGCGNVAVSGGVFDCEGEALFGAFACAKGLRVENVLVKDLPNNHAIQLVACEDVVVTNCVFAGYTFGEGASCITRETIQVEDSCPTSLSGDPATAAIRCAPGDSRANRRVAVAGCWFGPSDRLGPQLIALGHHGTPRSCNGLLFVGNTVVDPLYCGIRLANVSDVLVEANRFVSGAPPRVMKDDAAFVTVWGRAALAPGEKGITVRGNVFDRQEGSHLMDVWVSPRRVREVSVESGATNIDSAPAGGLKRSSLVVVDPARKVGKVKPMNAVNNGPAKARADQRLDCWDAFVQLKIPYARSHDAAHCSAYGGSHMGDVSAMFPDFSADETKPGSYDFTLTDKYVRDFASAGVRTFFRIGQSIEHWPKKYGVLPPGDYAKWARVAERIVAHYTEGWANGFDAGIEYWEIWNEPDLDAKGERWRTNPRTWGGSPEEFYRLYATAARHLKARFPHLKIGGPGIARAPGKWGEDFLAYCRDNEAPLDFLSWHGYIVDPRTAASRAIEWRRLLDAYGFSAAESVYNEWNYVEDWGDGFARSVAAIHGGRGAAFVAATMAACQKAPVDMLMYYDLRPATVFNGVFDFYTRAPLPSYWAFYAWRKLADLGDEIACEVTGEGLYAVAASDRTGGDLPQEAHGATLIVNYAAEGGVSREIAVSVQGRGLEAAKVHMLSSRFAYSEVECPIRDGCLFLRLEPDSFAFMEW